MKTEGKRLSERITVALRIQVIGSDAKGQMFADETETLLINRDGAKIALPHELAPEQEITIRCLATGQEATARVVGRVGTSPEGYLYGVEILDRDVDLWGIRFPPLADSAEAAGRVLLECMACHAREVAYLNDLELEVFQSSYRLSRNCANCKQTTLWGECQHEAPSKREQMPLRPEAAAPAARPAAPAQAQDRRKSPRLRVKAGVCVRGYGRAEERLVTEDVSRGGFCFQSRKQYSTGSLIEVAVPYTPGGVNIFVPARIAWAHEQPGTGVTTYGVAYIHVEKDSARR